MSNTTWRDCRWCGVHMLSSRSICADCRSGSWVGLLIAMALVAALVIAAVDQLVGAM